MLFLVLESWLLRSDQPLNPTAEHPGQLNSFLCVLVTPANLSIPKYRPAILPPGSCRLVDIGYTSHMQSLQDASNVSTGAYLCAQELFDTVPLVMRIIRKYMRQHRSGLTVAQFRTIYCVSQSPNSSLSDVADSIGLSLPAMSRMVDGLVEKGYLDRRTCVNDRRHVRLSVTPLGETALRESRELAQAQLAEVVSQLSGEQQREMIEVMRVVRDVFTAEVSSESAEPTPCHDPDPGKRQGD